MVVHFPIVHGLLVNDPRPPSGDVGRAHVVERLGAELRRQLQHAPRAVDVGGADLVGVAVFVAKRGRRVPDLCNGPDARARHAAPFRGHIARDDATPREGGRDVDRGGVGLGRTGERFGEASLRGRCPRGACEHDDSVVRLREELEHDRSADEACRSRDEVGRARGHHVVRDSKVEGGLESRLARDGINQGDGSFLHAFAPHGPLSRLATSGPRMERGWSLRTCSRRWG